MYVCVGLGNCPFTALLIHGVAIVTAHPWCGNCLCSSMDKLVTLNVCQSLPLDWFNHLFRMVSIFHCTAAVTNQSKPRKAGDRMTRCASGHTCMGVGTTLHCSWSGGAEAFLTVKSSDYMHCVTDCMAPIMVKVVVGGGGLVTAGRNSKIQPCAITSYRMQWEGFKQNCKARTDS